MTEKYRNKKTTVDGIQFDSKREAARYAELKLLERLGSINNLELQRPFIVIPRQECERSTVYRPDFVYYENGFMVVEDVKSKPTITPQYVMKRKLMKLVHNISVKEIF